MEHIQIKIEKAKHELEQMIDLNPQVMLLVNRDGRITRANKALLALLGLPGYPAVLGKQLEDVFPCQGGISRLLLRRVGNSEHEADVVMSGGQVHALHFTVVGVGAGDEFRVIIVRDVAAEKELAASLETQHKKEAAKAVAGALMHNVNQSLTVIMVNAQLLNLMLENGQMNSTDLAKSLEDIVRETICIASVLRDVGHPSKFVTEPYPGNTEIMDIKRSAECVGDDSGVAPRASLWLESSYEATVSMLLAALDVHEAGSFMHAKRTAEYAVILARRMGLSDDDVVKIRGCAALHDVGKLVIPDNILRKPSPLNDGETSVIRRHSEFGYNLLRNFPFAQEEAEVARSHHERWDGAGYPMGLAGKAIHPMARIVTVADCFDALRCERAYRKVVSDDIVVAGIIAGSGAQFDPEVVKAFAASVEELKSLVLPESKV